jgi:hypothetical protein
MVNFGMGMFFCQEQNCWLVPNHFVLMLKETPTVPNGSPLEKGWVVFLSVT